MDATDWEPLKELFERASALPGEEQAAFLEDACSDDPSKQAQLASLRAFQVCHSDDVGPALARLQEVALAGGNVFAELLEAVKVASLGQISDALFEVGGQYRRAM